MLPSAGARGLVPAFRVRINGAALPPAAAEDLLTAAVYDDVEAPGMFVLRLVNWDMDRLRVTWSDDDLFAAGNVVEIEMGYVDQLERVMAGEITGLEPEFNADEVPTLTVRGYDRRHRLLRGRTTRSFTGVKDSDIASRIASERGLTARAEDTGVTLDYVLQHDQTDWEFLQERARRIAYEVVVEDRTLHFRPRRHTESALLTLTRTDDLIEFYPRLSTLSQVGQVAVRGWSPSDKAPIVARAGAGAEATTMGGTTTGPAAADRAFGQTRAAGGDRPVFSQAEADQLARGQLDDLALAYIGGEGLCDGRTNLRAGAVAQLEGLGRRFSGRYYVTSTTHTYAPLRGYRTAFTVRRNAT